MDEREKAGAEEQSSAMIVNPAAMDALHRMRKSTMPRARSNAPNVDGERVTSRSANHPPRPKTPILSLSADRRFNLNEFAALKDISNDERDALAQILAAPVEGDAAMDFTPERAAEVAKFLADESLANLYSGYLAYEQNIKKGKPKER